MLEIDLVETLDIYHCHAFTIGKDGVVYGVNAYGQILIPNIVCKFFPVPEDQTVSDNDS